MIRTLHIHSFKKHRDLDIEFSVGFNLIQGPNYSGKTTVVQAILYALYGHSPAMGTTAGIAHKDGSGKALPAHVGMTFDVGPETYHITRKGKTAELACRDEVLATGITAVNAAVLDITRMDRTLFEQLRYSPQNETSAMVFQGTAYLQQLIESLANTQIINTVISKCDGVAAGAHASMEALGQVDVEAIRQNVKGMQEFAEELYKESARLSVLSQASVQAVANGAANYERVYTALIEANARQAKKESMTTLLDVLTEQVTSLSDYLRAHPDVNSERLEELVELGQQHKSYLSQLQTEHAVAASAHSAVRVYQQTVDRLQEGLGPLHELVSSLSYPTMAAMEQLFEEAVRLTDQTREAEAEHNRISVLLKDSVCPTCNQPLTGVDVNELGQRYETTGVTLRNLNAARMDANAAYDRVHKQATTHASAMENYTRHEEELQQAQAVLEQARRELPAYAPADLAVAQGNCDDVLRQHAQMEQQLDDVRKARRDMDEVLEKRNRLAVDLDILMREIGASYSPAQTEVEVHYKALQDLQAAEAATRGNSETAYHQHKGALREVQGLTNQLREAERRDAQWKAHAERKASAQSLNKFLKGNRDRFLNRTWDSVLALTSDFVSICTRGEVTNFERNESGVFTYVERGQEQPLVNASGAQRAMLGTGMRLALTSIMPVPLDITLLDEISSDMRDENALLVSQTMRTYCSGQVIAISHRDMDSAVADHVIDLS